MAENTSKDSSRLDQSTLDTVKALLEQGGVIVFPTDTAYGLGCMYNNKSAIQRILKIKGRIDNKFTLIASSIEQAQAYFPDTFTASSPATALAKAYWPGPLSIVVDDQFAIRVPDNPIAQQIAAIVDTPVIATSANITGGVTHRELEEAQDDLGGKNIDMWIDGGVLPLSKPSTIIKVITSKGSGTQEGEQYPAIEIIRYGAVEIESL